MANSPIVLTVGQAAVLDSILGWLRQSPAPFLTVGGYAGTGKTTLIAYLRACLEDLKEPRIKQVAFCCYTGKATAVLRQKLKDAQTLDSKDSCTTIHSLIYKAVTDDDGQVSRWDRMPTLGCDLVIIDEGSMVNAEIWRDLLSYDIPILVFGDHGQLPPVEGSFNLMQSPQLKLEEIVRQAEGNPIIRLSRHVRNGGEIPFGIFGSVHKFSIRDEEGWERFDSLMTNPGEDYLCICGTNRTRVGLNQRIRGLNDIQEPEPQRGDRVICLKNNHAKLIFNGMLGTISSIKPDGEHWYDLRVDMEDRSGAFQGRVLKYQFNQQKTLRGDAAKVLPVPIPERELGDLFDFGYALTAHKAQGSEAKRVIVFEERMFNYDEEMWRRWLYTAITRAKEDLYVFA